MPNTPEKRDKVDIVDNIPAAVDLKWASSVIQRKKILEYFQNWVDRSPSGLDPIGIQIQLDESGILDELSKLASADATIIIEYIRNRFKLSGRAVTALQQKIGEYKSIQESSAHETTDELLNDFEGKAKYYEYVRLFDQELLPRRCLVRDQLMTWDEVSRFWIPASLRIDSIKSLCLDSKGFSPTRVEPHFYRYEQEKNRELLIDISTWDNVDRLKVMADCLNCLNFEPGEVYELLAEWGAKMYARIFNPQVRNKILVLKGPQEIGKDWYVDTLVGGLSSGDYVKNLSLYGDNNEGEAMLHTGIVFKISEFDRTARTQVALLKHLITTPETDIRLKFERCAKKRLVRASFIATCNVDEILRDDTGNSRFLILDVKEINFNYPGHDEDPNRDKERLQILAQFKHLKETNFILNSKVAQKLQQYQEDYTPENMVNACADFFDREVYRLIEATPEMSVFKLLGYVQTRHIELLMERVNPILKLTITQFRQKLVAAGRGIRTDTHGRCFKFYPPPISIEKEAKENLELEIFGQNNK